MNILNLTAIVFVAVLALDTAYAVTSFYISTYEATPKYLKGTGGSQIKCESGSGGSRLQFYILEPGLTRKSNEVSFKSADYDKYYIAEVFGSIYLEKFENSRSFGSAASFIKRRNYYNRGTVSYESINFPGYFLMCKDGFLTLDVVNFNYQSAGASFVTETASSDNDQWGPCSRTCGGGVQSPKRVTCISMLFCEEPRTRPCNTQKCPTTGNPCQPNPCQNEGQCSRSGSSYICYCRTGYTGKNCENSMNSCKPNPCQHGGHCSKSGNDYMCFCASGYTGKNCEKATNPCRLNPCQNGGQCSRSGKSYVCDCKSGYTGKNCENEPTPCKPNPCENGGQCSRSGKDYTCACPSGFTGKNCNKVASTPCKPNPCQNGGQCSRSGSSYTCDCKTGFLGKNCEQSDPCSPNPCRNDGLCSKNGNDYTCSCKPGFHGDKCQHVDNCLSQPCLNGGTCLRKGSDFECRCTPGHTGIFCDKLVSSGCDSSPCMNGGTCTNTDSGFKCKCDIGYHGKMCEKALRIGEWSPCSRSCGGGTRYKGMSCSANNVVECPREYEDCNMDLCPRATCATYRYRTNSECCTSTSGSCGAPSAKRSGARIIGGQRSKEGEWPWSAALYHKPSEKFFCGGVIINNEWIVTAGHCAGEFKASLLQVLVGTIDRETLDDGHKWFDVDERILHSGYDNPIHDIGLLKLKNKITFTSTIKPICLPNGERLEVDTMCYASGWGVALKENIAKRIPSDVLLHVGLRTLPLDACVQGYRNTGFQRGVTEDIICSGVIGGGRDTCVGDSGGPLMCQRKNSCEWYLAGVTSFGATECGVGTIPGGFMDVQRYEKWIKEKISEN